jgi:NAD(P)-dependent dehydrogenase (short-subunit alcohol dehydrogenase family)
MGWFEERAGLEGSVAVVTGGAGGLGRAIVEDLAANGVRVAVIDIDEKAVDSLRGEAEGRKIEMIALHGDARDPDALAELFATSDQRWGRLDILVSVVGGTFRAPFVETRPKGWDALLRTNLTHVLHSSSLAIPRMRTTGGGSIINISTIEAHRAAPGYAVYSAAKAGVEEFARTLAVEVAPYGIRVNNVAPDFVPTPALESVISDEIAYSTPTGLQIGIPMGRPGKVTDVSNCVVFLASDLSSYITGTTLHPDGGTYASAGWFNWPGAGWQNHAPIDVVRYLDSQA